MEKKKCQKKKEERITEQCENEGPKRKRIEILQGSKVIRKIKCNINIIA